MQFLTINKTAAEIGLPRSRLRTMLSAHSLPGFYAGTRYYVNVDLLREMLEEECKSSIKKENK